MLRKASGITTSAPEARSTASAVVARASRGPQGTQLPFPSDTVSHRWQPDASILDAAPDPLQHDVGARAGSDAAARVPEGGFGTSVVVWLRQDLRLHDNPALHHAARRAKAHNSKVVLLYVDSPSEDGDAPWWGKSWRPGACNRLWHHHALESFQADVKARYGPGAAVVFAKGPYLPAVVSALQGAEAGALFYNRRYEPAMRAADDGVRDALLARGVAVESFNAHLLREPEEVTVDMSRWAGHFGTLMPFVRASEAAGPPQKALPAPENLPVGDEDPSERCGGVPLAQLGLLPTPRKGVDWGAAVASHWDISEKAALELLDRFVASSVGGYEADKGFADARGVSKLSPYLHSGQLSARTMLAELARAGAKGASGTLWRRLAWRDLAYWQLHHWPAMCRDPIRGAGYNKMVWNDDPEALRAWQEGRTGFPLVDAGMRELWQTGWMQQNVRMAAALCLTEYLGIHWIEGLRWFHDTLVDADLAINSMMWQNAGKSGLDQWNYTVSPCTKVSDPSGDYVRKWVPELAGIPGAQVHQPWQCKPDVLRKAGVVLGETYPHRIIPGDLAAAREATARAIREARASKPKCIDAGGYDIIEPPAGSVKGLKGPRVRVFTTPLYRGTTQELAGRDFGPAPKAEKAAKRGSGAEKDTGKKKGGKRNQSPQQKGGKAKSRGNGMGAKRRRAGAMSDDGLRRRSGRDSVERALRAYERGGAVDELVDDVLA
ncbi:unnamed protein product [Pedinophyceae sp. YPF-701]|nr:unnamed protein product [Pedinophyceae sp. YPF-701]